MSEPRVTLTVDQLERLLYRQEEIEKMVQETRNILSEGSVQAQQTPPTVTKIPPVESIVWLRRDRSPANAEDEWAWAFITEKDGSVPPGRQQLVDYLKRFGKVQQAGYEITLSKEGKLLNRKKIREGSP